MAALVGSDNALSNAIREAIIRKLSENIALQYESRASTMTNNATDSTTPFIDSNEDLWLRLLNLSGLAQFDDRLIFTMVLCLINITLFYGCNILLQFMYSYKMFPQYRINSGKMPSKELIWICLKETAISNFIIQPLLAYWIGYPLLISYMEMPFRSPLPNMMIMARDWMFAFVINDTLFYWIHRCILHHPLLYKYIHKQHHMFHEPIGISASYASAIESVLAGLIPNIASCCMMKTHFVVFVCFIGWKVIEGIELHSGYAFP
jgi:sterol desaturase/sphingolipid hydroxylase (fatty acid hydroxylase superfamily)